MENVLRNTLVILTWNQFDIMNSLYVLSETLDRSIKGT